MRILVVDDHPIFLKGVEFLLGTHHPGCQIQAVAGSAEAMREVSWRVFDLIILDLNLPEMTGVELLRAMAQKEVTTPTLVMSAEIRHDQIKSALRYGALGFIPKSFQPEEMLLAIREVREGRQYLPQELADALSARNATNAHSRGITPRQVAVLELVAEGISNREIAQSLNLTEYTIKSHVCALFAALECKNRTACVRIARAEGLLLAE